LSRQTDPACIIPQTNGKQRSDLWLFVVASMGKCHSRLLAGHKKELAPGNPRKL
jgi:hypothetical protein